MKLKLFTTGTVAAIVLGSSCMIAYRHELIGGPSPLPEEAHVVAHPVMVPGPKLTPIEEALHNPRKFKPLSPDQIDSETLWLARVIYSETKRADEQVLVAWVVRNRVESRYRGKATYEGVVLDPWQFSAFQPDNEKRPFYAGLNASSRVPGWQTALNIAYNVRRADHRHRPFSPSTRHFYSQRSMTDAVSPHWAEGMAPVEIGYHSIQIDERRFRFFEDVS